jgi:hypothetical protein
LEGVFFFPSSTPLGFLSGYLVFPQPQKSRKAFISMDEKASGCQAALVLLMNYFGGTLYSAFQEKEAR